MERYPTKHASSLSSTIDPTTVEEGLLDCEAHIAITQEEIRRL